MSRKVRWTNYKEAYPFFRLDPYRIVSVIRKQDVYVNKKSRTVWPSSTDSLRADKNMRLVYCLTVAVYRIPEICDATGSSE